MASNPAYETDIFIAPEILYVDIPRLLIIADFTYYGILVPIVVN